MNHIKTYINKAFTGIALMAMACACTNDDGYYKGDIVASELAPVVSFEASATSVEAGTTITFTDTSSNTPTLWTWNMPGGSPSYSNEANPSVKYAGAGTYSVSLTVRNEHGADEVAFENYIEVTAPPIIDIDTKAQVRYTFDDTLDSDLEKGLQDITATSGGALQYGIRPGGGGAYVFTGSNSLEIPGYTGINGAGARSVAMWIKTTKTGRTGLAHWGASGSLSRASFKLHDNKLRFEYQGGSVMGTTVINDNQWRHVAYTYDGDTVILYINGEVELTKSNVTLNTGVSGETNVTIGSQGGAFRWEGMMDDFRVFDKVITPEEVQILSEMK